jgi:hypothetical protein
VTVEQYLEMERAAEFRSEYIDGEVFAMAGGSVNHAVIAGAVGASIGAQVDVSRSPSRNLAGRRKPPHRDKSASGRAGKKAADHGQRQRKADRNSAWMAIRRFMAFSGI